MIKYLLLFQIFIPFVRQKICYDAFINNKKCVIHIESWMKGECYESDDNCI